MSQQNLNNLGRVFLVGAGPGAPGLLTLRGLECLRAAEVVIYDYLVNPQILAHAPASAEFVCLGKHGRDRLLSQDEVNARLVAAAGQGKTVVRLKGGDPAVFARVAEETGALAAAGIPFEIVPGITAALAVGSHAGIPLTHREHASAVALVTGHECDDKPDAALDYAALATFPGTLVFYMGVTSAAHWAGALLAAGKAPSTPVALVRRCSWPDQTTLRCTLGTVVDELARRKLRPPVIVVVGDVAAAECAVTGFITRPLQGQAVLVTRPEGQADALADLLTEQGAAVWTQPAIRIAAPEDWSPVDAALTRLDTYDWLVFSSANGVQYLLDRLLATGGDLRRLGRVKLAAIGPATSEALAHYHLRADLQPGEYRAEALATELAAVAAGKRILLARRSRGREVLAEQLRAAGATVEQVVVYRSEDVTEPRPEVAAALAAGQLDWVTVTSSAIARALVAMFGDSLRRTKLASISPITSTTLRELGHEPSVEASEYTMPGVVQAMMDAEGK